ncbi:neuraminidase-like domain-containing protein [Accumulibacter sp.]|uniref:Tc toxin subunit A-related protein n=1 Tax=Accumulibacter sp. TaxID=2053492 RepID=UPI0028C43D2A|nr:neuraminidase-like domain-containing protein [Accumulibacter sp.]
MDEQAKALQQALDTHPKVLSQLLAGQHSEADVLLLPEQARELGRNLGRYLGLGITLEAGTQLWAAGVQTPGHMLGLGVDVIQNTLSDQQPTAYVQAFFRQTQKAMVGAKGMVSALVSTRIMPLGLHRQQVPISGEVVESLPTMRGLFGDVDECACRPCESVLGLPAYLVDLLNLLKRIPSHKPAVANALGELRARRPDILRLPLGCEEAETEVQHIDLVVEVLQQVVGPTVDLAAQVYPWTLPHVRVGGEVDAWLVKLGLDRAKWMAQLHGQRTNPHHDVGLAAQRLGLSVTLDAQGSLRGAWPLVATAAINASEVWPVYGFASDTSVSVRDPASGKLVSGVPLTLLSAVSIVLDRSGLELADLEQALRTRFVAGTAGSSLGIASRDSCKTSEMQVTSLSWEVLDRLHRFVRLWRGLGAWSMAVLDSAIVACQPPGASGLAVDRNVLMRLGRVVAIQRQLKLRPESVLGLFRPIDEVQLLAADGSRVQTLYEATYRSRRLTEAQRLLLPTDPRAPNAFALGAGLAALAPELGLGLRCSPQAVARWIRVGTAPAPAYLIQDSLGLDSLAALYRRHHLATALDRSPEDLALMLAMTGSAAYAGDADMFCGAMEALLDAQPVFQRSGLDVQETAQILLPVFDHQDVPQRPELAPDWRDIKDTLLKLRVALLSITQLSGDEATLVASAQDALAAWLPAGDVPNVMLALQGKSEADVSAAMLALEGPVPGVPGATGEASTLLTPAQASQLLLRTTAVERLGGLLERVQEIRRQATLRSDLCRWTRLPEPVMDRLLAGELGVDAADPALRRAVVALLDTMSGCGLLEEGVADETAAHRNAFVQWMYRLSRLARLLERLHPQDSIGVLRCLQTAEVLSVQGPRRFSWNTLLAPSDGSSAIDRWADWRALVGTTEMLKERLVSAQWMPGLLAALGAAGSNVTESTVAPMASAWQVDPAELVAFMTALLPGPIGWRDPGQWLRATEVLKQSARLGIEPGSLRNSLAPITGPSALAIVRAIGSQRSEGWFKEVDDSTKSAYRDALLAHATTATGKTAEQLYEHYLIDMRMAPCMRTTRVLQAIASVQQLVHRILFGLEPGIGARVGLDLANVRGEWKWMSQYRVWEANRKVFLFPENWLLPELRDDKSHAFVALESALGESELTQGAAAAAFGTFLDELAHTAQLLVLGMFEDTERQAGVAQRRDLYVVGRTPNPPYAYYWRRCKGFGHLSMQWSPWKLVELDIQGDHVMPFVMKGQLHMAWPLFKQPDTNAAKPQWEVNLAWARLTESGWLRQESTREPQRVDADPLMDERDGFAFRVGSSATGDGITVHVYAAKASVQSSWSPPIDREFTNQHSSGGAKLSVSCTMAVQAKNSKGFPVWVQLDPLRHATYVQSHQSHSLQSEPKPDETRESASFFVYPPGVLDTWPVAFSVKLKGWATVDGKTISSDEKSRDVGKNQNVSWHPVFRFTSNPELTVDDLNVDKAPARFEEVARFDFRPDLRVTRSSGTSAAMPMPVQRARPYMNGYRTDQPGSATALALSTSQTASRALLEQTASGDFWALGAASATPWNGSADAWYYEEEGTSAFFDLKPDAAASAAAFRVFPSRHQDAAHISQGFREAQLPDTAGLQGGAFVDALVRPRLDANAIKDVMAPTHPGDKLAVDLRLPYACYNWEIYLHAPLLLASRLSQAGRYADAEQWLRIVMDPTTGQHDQGLANSSRFLRFPAFRYLDASQTARSALVELAQAKRGLPATGANAVADLIRRWREIPFTPYLIARTRPLAFLWRTVFAYLDNLLAWADDLFRRDTRESINEATQLYVLASRILGAKPKVVKGTAHRPTVAYDQYERYWDDFANLWLDVARPSGGWQSSDARSSANHLSEGNGDVSISGLLYFCIPINPKLFSYWDTVEERLFNIRHCRNIDGITRDLPLVEAPIDPELLIRATAAGLEISDVLRDLYAPPHRYRYQVLVARALDLANETKTLGAALLSAIEKRDGERMAQLRSTNEISLLQRVQGIRQLQIDEALESLQALRVSRANTAKQYEHFQRLLGKDGTAPEEGSIAPSEEILAISVDSRRPFTDGFGGLGLIEAELANIEYLGHANGWSIAGGVSKTLAALLHTGGAIADSVKEEGVAKVLKGFGTAAGFVGDAAELVSKQWQYSASREQQRASYVRRRDDSAYQCNQALARLRHEDKGILAFEIKLSIARNELENQRAQIRESKDVDAYLRAKYSNAELYDWMRSELAALHSSTYRLALNLARRAERAAAAELGLPALNLIGNGGWVGGRSGLLAGEHLQHDLKRLEIAYLEQNRREYELTRHVSLRRLNPLELLKLKAAGACEFDIPEWLFDMDAPGHYMRRIKTVSLSIPCVVGPYASVNCKLTLVKSSIRTSTSGSGSGASSYPRAAAGDDSRFTVRHGAVESIVTSSGRDDSGLFETALRDERYLPFESAGAISRWRLELPGLPRQMDFDTISDVILHIRYTAREGGEGLRTAAQSQFTVRGPAQASASYPPVLLSCRNDFPNEWATAIARRGTLRINLSLGLLPYWMQALTGLAIGKVSTITWLGVDPNALQAQVRWPTPDTSLPPLDLSPNGTGLVDLGEVSGTGDVLILLEIT